MLFLKISLILIAIGILGGVGYYTLSPLWTVIERNDPRPHMSKETPNPDTEKTVEPLVLKTSRVIGTGAHPAEGVVKTILTDRGVTVRYEDYETINGPDLRVYLTKDLDAKEFIDLGPIKGTKGNVNYDIPSNIDFTKYKYILTWCRAFSVLFNSAEIN